MLEKFFLQRNILLLLDNDSISFCSALKSMAFGYNINLHTTKSNTMWL